MSGPRAGGVLLLRTFSRSRGSSVGSRGHRIGGGGSSGVLRHGSGGVASGSGGVTSGVGSLAGGVSGLAGSSRGISSRFLRGFGGRFFFLRAAGERQGGKGGSECNFRVHSVGTPI
jgi:hypothetical protein